MSEAEIREALARAWDEGHLHGCDDQPECGRSRLHLRDNPYRAGGGYLMSDLTPEQDDYFRTLAKIDPSPEMARVIEQAKQTLANRPPYE